MNILWIVTTQWRAQACGYAGDANVRTPALDALARRSINYAQAVSPHPFGPFARAALLTGIRSPENGIRDYFDPLPETAETIACRLNALGYATAFFGKWHLAKRDPEAPLVGLPHAKTIVPPASRGGFSFWEGFESGFQLNNPWLHGTGLKEPTAFPGYQSDVLFERSGEWIEAATQQPWFCMVSIEPPHPPYTEAPGFQPSRADSLTLDRNVPTDLEIVRQTRAELAGYYGQIEATDRALGKLLARIDTANTAVIFTSVHGDMHGAHGLFRKGWPYEESVRVPLLVQIPGRTPEVCADPISLLDLCSRTIELARDRRWQDWDPTIDAACISMPSVVPFPRQCDRRWTGLRNSTRKLILNADGTPWLFFNLEQDPFEMENLVGNRGHQPEIESWREKVDVGQLR